MPALEVVADHVGPRQFDHQRMIAGTLSLYGDRPNGSGESKIDDQGGAVAAIAFMQREIHDAAYRYQREVEARTRIVVGVNEFVTDEPPQTKSTLGANTAQVTVRVDARTGTVLALGAIDNLVKGAAGQAVQNLNILLGLDERTGLL